MEQRYGKDISSPSSFTRSSHAASGTVPTTLDLGLPARGFGFALADYKVNRREFRPVETLKTSSAAGIPNFRGVIHDRPVFDPSGPIEGDSSSLVLTEKGIRPLIPDEWKKLKGVPSSWKLRPRHVEQLIADPGLHVWSVVGQVVQELIQDAPGPGILLSNLPREGLTTWGDPNAPEDDGKVSWRPPDLI